MSKIKMAIVGVGNGASALVQGIEYYDGEQEEAGGRGGLAAPSQQK